MAHSEEKTDFLGNKYTEHYDDDGQKVGESREREDFLGNKYSEHTDIHGQKTGESREGEDFLGNKYSEHRDIHGQRTGESHEGEDFLGNKYSEHRDIHGQKTGESREREDFLGNKYSEHTDDGGVPPMCRTSPNVPVGEIRDQASHVNDGGRGYDRSYGGVPASSSRASSSKFRPVIVACAIILGLILGFFALPHYSPQRSSENSSSDGRISPDGRHIVVGADKSFELSLRHNELPYGKVVLRTIIGKDILTWDRSQYGNLLSWSPDSKHLIILMRYRLGFVEVNAAQETNGEWRKVSLPKIPQPVEKLLGWTSPFTVQVQANGETCMLTFGSSQVLRLLPSRTSGSNPAVSPQRTKQNGNVAMLAPTPSVAADTLGPRYTGKGRVYKVPELKNLVGQPLMNAWLYGDFILKSTKGNVGYFITSAVMLLPKEGSTQIQIEFPGGIKLSQGAINALHNSMLVIPVKASAEDPVQLLGVERMNDGRLFVRARAHGARQW
jgi:hypothetical protein